MAPRAVRFDCQMRGKSPRPLKLQKSERCSLPILAFSAVLVMGDRTFFLGVRRLSWRFFRVGCEDPI